VEKLTEGERPEVPVSETAPQPERRQGIAEIISGLRSGKVDPITALLMMSELRRMDRDEERWELEKSLRSNPPKQVDVDEIVKHVKESLQPPEPKVDVEKVIKEINNVWESRFKEYQHHIETLILGRKLEETEARAKQAEVALKETKAEIEQHKLLEEKVKEATAPLKNQIAELQAMLAQKTAGMTDEERKNVFQNIGEQIEQAITGEVADTIAKNVSQSIMAAFTPKEKEETPVTAEGKFDWPKAINKWVTKGLEAAKAIAEKMPARPPPLRQVQQIPIQIPMEMPPETPTPTPIKTEPVPIKLSEEKPKEEAIPEMKVEKKEIEIPIEEPKPKEEAKAELKPTLEVKVEKQEKREESKPVQKTEAKAEPKPKPKTPTAKTKKPEAHTTKHPEKTPEGTAKQTA
jgi:hypothetical protein